MANIFDQFDPPPAQSKAAPRANIFDQFDPPATAPASPNVKRKPNVFDQFDGPAAQPAPAAWGNVFDQFDAAPVAPAAPPKDRNYVADVTQSFGSGIVRGAAETAMLPVTAKRALDAGASWLYDKGEGAVRSAFGMDPRSAETQALIDEARARSAASGIDSAIFGAQDSARGVMDEYLHKPETTPGKFAETVGEFVQPGILVNGGRKVMQEGLTEGLKYAAPRIMGEAVVPGVASEAAGQLTDGTDFEPYARLLGAIAGNAAVVIPKAYNTVDNVARRAIPENVDWEKAQALQNNRFGIGLTGPEAVTEAAGGSSALQDVQRVVEGSIPGKQRLVPFFAERQNQIDDTISGPGGFLDAIGPQSSSPTALGPVAADAAENALRSGPEGSALLDAITRAGPRTTDMAAGEVIQPSLADVFARREGMRNALGDADFEAARKAAPTIPVDDLRPQSGLVESGYTRLDPNVDIHGQPEMAPTGVSPKYDTPALVSNTGPDMIQVDARSAVRQIDALRAAEKGGASDALEQVRNMLFTKGGVDTSVAGLDNARRGVNDMINEAKQAGKMHVVEQLTRAREALDAALETSPEVLAANKNFAAASEPLAPFTGTAAGKVIARDEFNKRFTMNPEDVPSALRVPSELKNLKTVAPPEALDAMQNNMATRLLDSVTDAKGNVSVERLQLALRDNTDILDQMPAVRDRLNEVVNSASGLERVRASSPLGKIASAPSTEAAAGALAPRKPLVGASGETADTVKRMVEQDADTTRQLLRQEFGQRWSEASKDTQAGTHQTAGIKFRNAVAGNDEQRAVLDAILENLPSPDAAKMAPDLLDVLSATGKRQNIGSPTAPNTAIVGELSAGGPLGRGLGMVRSGGASFFRNGVDDLKRAAYGKSVEGLADLFADPQSVDMLREIATNPASYGFLEALKRSARQAPLAMRER